MSLMVELRAPCSPKFKMNMFISANDLAMLPPLRQELRTTIRILRAINSTKVFQPPNEVATLESIAAHHYLARAGNIDMSAHLIDEIGLPQQSALKQKLIAVSASSMHLMKIAKTRIMQRERCDTVSTELRLSAPERAKLKEFADNLSLENAVESLTRQRGIGLW